MTVPVNHTDEERNTERDTTMRALFAAWDVAFVASTFDHPRHPVEIMQHLFDPKSDLLSLFSKQILFFSH